MTDKPWVEEARRLIEGGMSVQLAARSLGKSEYAVRWNLDINNFRERRALEESRRNRRKPKPEPKPLSPETIKRRQWGRNDQPGAIPSGGKITLPALSFLERVEPEPPKAIRFAPKSHVPAEPPRVSTIRAIHQRMIRTGKISAPDITTEMR